MRLSPKTDYSFRNTLLPSKKKLLHRLVIKGNTLLDNFQDYNKRPLDNSLIISGFWRSGTTISQDIFSEVLKAKPYFEPFEPGLPGQARYVFDFARCHGLDYNDRPFVALLMPHVKERSNGTSDGLWQYLDSIVLGGFSHAGLLRNRKTLLEGLRRNKCVKFVRAHFILKALWERYNIPIVHIRRHPFSVVASLVKVKHWNQNGFEAIDIHKLLQLNLSTTDSSSFLFESLNKLPADLNKIQKISAYWCVAEIVAERAIKSIQNGAKIVQFESLMSLQRNGVDDILNSLDLRANGNLSTLHFTKMSKTSHADLNKKYNPHTAYKKILEPADIVSIADMCEHFGIEVRRIEEDIQKNSLYCHSLKLT